MNTSRRQAIKLGISATASLVAVNGLWADVAHAQNPPSPADDDASWLRRDLFENCRGEVMVARTSGRSIGLRLMRVDDVPSAHLTGAVNDPNSFIVVFRGPRSPRLRQGTYPIESALLGAFPLFLVPGLTNWSGTMYSATFNRV